MKTLLAVVLVTIASLDSHAAELNPRINEKGLGALFAGIAFPETLSRDLMSGLENRLLIRVALFSEAQAIARRDFVVTVKYDLWEELFRVQQSVDGKTLDAAIFRRGPEIIQHLSNLKLDGLLELRYVPIDKDLTMQAHILVNPVEREKIERLRQWVASNSAPGGGVAAGSATTPLTAKPNDLFNRIFEQYIRGDEISAPWTTTIVSTTFKPRLLQRESLSQ